MKQQEKDIPFDIGLINLTPKIIDISQEELKEEYDLFNQYYVNDLLPKMQANL